MIWFGFGIHAVMQWWHHRIRFYTCSFERRFILRTVLMFCRKAFTGRTCSFERRFILRTVLVCCRNTFTRRILFVWIKFTCCPSTYWSLCLCCPASFGVIVAYFLWILRGFHSNLHRYWGVCSSSKTSYLYCQCCADGQRYFFIKVGSSSDRGEQIPGDLVRIIEL
jgi:hypothetical protein